MSRTLYDALAGPLGDADPWARQDEAPHPMLRALAREGRLRRAARELADDELREGAWVDEEAPPVAKPVRLAAQDVARAPRVYAAGRWAVRAETGPDGARTLTQEAGPVGATVVLAGPPDHYVPLVPGVPAAVPEGVALPDALALLDAAGRTVTLPRRTDGA